MSKIKLTAVILTANEAANIKKCFSGLKFCDEVIVIDDFSDDRTSLTAKKLGIKVFKHKLNADFSAQRNFGLQKARGEWVLFVDADERVSLTLAREIKEVIKKNEYSGYRVRRQDVFLGKVLRFGETANLNFLRLAKKSSGLWVRPVHEVWNVKGKIGKLETPLLHYPHPTIEEFLRVINHYTDLEAQYRSEIQEKPSFAELLIFPLFKFLNNYFFLLGFADKFPGLVMAFMMSLHSLILRAKVFFKR